MKELERLRGRPIGQVGLGRSGPIQGFAIGALGAPSPQSPGPLDGSDAQRVISERLVEFRNAEELLIQNKKLLLALRMQTDQMVRHRARTVIWCMHASGVSASLMSCWASSY
jgi:hypothetical protein